MQQHCPAHSRLARLVVAVAAATATGLAASPVHAEPPGDGYILALLSDFAIGGVGAPGKAVPLWVDTARAVDPKVTIDFSDVAGVATLTIGDECQVSGTTATCELPDLERFLDAIPLHFQPADGVRDGAEATIVYTTAAANLPSERQTATLTVRDGFDLVALAGEPVEAEPGDHVDTQVRFANLGNQTATSAILLLSFSPGVVPDEYENCLYTPADAVPATLAQCELESDEPIAPDPDAVYELVGGFGVTIGPDAIGRELADFTIMGIDDASQLPETLKLSARGGAKKLTLTRTTVAAGQRALATEVDQEDNLAATEILVANRLDFAAVGAKRTGAVGDTVKVKVGVKNIGPSAPDQWGGDGTPLVEFTVAVPAGAEVVRAPASCGSVVVDERGVIDVVPGQAGGVYYRCVSDLAHFGAGETTPVELELKVTSPGVTAGAVSLDDKYREPPAWDDDANTNNTAALTITGTGQGGGGGGTGGGEGLPVTGVRVGALAGGGAALLVVGVVLVLVTRRRRVTPDPTR